VPRERVAVVGLGRIGGAMAARLADGGFRVRGHDARRPARLAPDVAWCEELRDVWQGVDVALLALPRPEDVAHVLTGAGGLVERASTAVRVIDASTGDPDVTQHLAAQLAAQGHALVDAPVSGGPADAEAGRLAMMLGGRADEIEAVRPVLEVLAATRVHVGASGAGHTAKLTNNVLCAAHLLLAGEALRLGTSTGIPAAALCEAVNEASGRSAVTQRNVPDQVLTDRFDTGFTMAQMAKDLSLAGRLAKRSGLSLPLIEAVMARWQARTAVEGADADVNRAFFGDEG